MIPVSCPICGKAFEIESLDELPSFPFCSDRCRMIDLGRWLDADYVLPGGPAPTEEIPVNSDSTPGSNGKHD